MALKASRPMRSRARRDAEHILACEPVPRGWSLTMRRWLAAQAAQNQVVEHWTAMVLDQPGGPVRIPLEAIKAVTVGNLSQVLDHRITRSLERTAHVVRFLDGGELRYACDHLGRLTELASLALRCTVSDDCTVVFNPPPPPDLEG
jgi:hypothetical protein